MSLWETVSRKPVGYIDTTKGKRNITKSRQKIDRYYYEIFFDGISLYFLIAFNASVISFDYICLTSVFNTKLMIMFPLINSIIPYIEVEPKIQRLASIPLERKTEQIIDIITSRLNRYNIEELSNSLFSSLFDLRIIILIKNKVPYNQIQDFITEEIINQDIKSSKEKYGNIFLSVFQDFLVISNESTNLKSNNKSQKILEEIGDNPISYEVINYFFESTSELIPSNLYIKRIVDESLKFDCVSLVLQMYLDNLLNIKDSRIENEIIPFLKTTLSNYGTYAILTDLWHPTKEQLDNPVFNSMKIKASIINADNGNFADFSLKNLQQLAS